MRHRKKNIIRSSPQKIFIILYILERMKFISWLSQKWGFVALAIFHCTIPKNHRSTLLRHPSERHKWELQGNCPVLIVVMLIYHCVERIWRFLVTPNFWITYIIMNKYYPGESVNIHIQSLINIIQENNWVSTIKRG